MVGKRNAFYRVIYKNLLGYVSYSVIDKTYEAFKATEYEHEPLIGIAKFPFELQSQPITNSQTKMLVTVPKDSLLPIKEHNEVYYKTTYKSIEGYAAKSYLNLTGDESDETYLRKYPKIKVAQTAPEEVEAYPTRNRTHSRQYYRGPRGGCYYITASGRKQYVDRSLCK
ncbi:hypothetical protein AWR27_03305 [Spirosoma montaniterrae]|uniref:Uncharacterized protein n=1 Tax=Spirosoma montaniterrae TaxID=1178516 RepID=A0A1P9WSY8_9BACT|nr:hypothetical protein AWR27_03305 [Spirosoma montaniterrae]